MGAVKYNEEIASELAGAISGGAPITVACQISGISRPTFYAWRRTYPEFDAKIREAEGNRQDTLIQNIRTKGEKDWKSDAWMLERTSRDFRESKEVSVGVERGVEEVLDAVREHMSAEAYGELVTAIARIQGVDTAEADSTEG